jgi:hypothetical protein
LQLLHVGFGVATELETLSLPNYIRATLGLTKASPNNMGILFENKKEVCFVIPEVVTAAPANIAQSSNMTPCTASLRESGRS